MFQYFEWNLPADGELWNQLARDARHLAEIGVTSVWIPPAYKGGGPDDVGYGVYDMYDFGEFDQKGTVRTKYGNRAELETAIKALHKAGLEVILDTVLNHRMNGDEPERFMAQPVAADDRMRPIGDTREIEAFTAFTFPGRADRYSPFKWHWYHFSGVDYDGLTGSTDIFRIAGPGKGWSQGVDRENGNYDFLMGNDVDVNNPEVEEEILMWGRWTLDSFGFDGFRMDAVKHIDNVFILRFLKEMESHLGHAPYAVSEYWSDSLDSLTGFIQTTEGRTDLFDVPLHFKFHEAALKGEEFAMNTLLDDTLLAADPQHAVTFVDNHDSQPGSSLSSNIDDWFKPLAYALILLGEGGYPVVFYGDYYSLTEWGGGDERTGSPHRKIIDILLDARRRFAYGEETRLFDHPSTVGLVRHGDDEHEGSGLVLLMSNGDNGTKTVTLGENHAGEVWHEITGSIPDTVTLDAEGKGEFSVRGRNIAVWVKCGDDYSEPGE